jgi:WD40 repeat protein
VLGISAEQAAELEKHVRDQLKEQPAPPIGDTQNASMAPPAGEQPQAPSEVDLYPPPIPETQEKLIACWNQPVESPIQVALFGSPVHALAVTEAGSVSVWSEDGRFLYREDVQGRPFRVAALAQKVFVGTWRGQLSCFGQHGLIWQIGLGSPISALAVSAGEPELVAGTWDGQIVAMRSDGAILWRTAVDDGISALSVTPAGRAVAVGTYAGSLATFDTQGNPGWLRDMQAPVAGVAFAEHGSAIVVATQDRLVTRIHLHTQENVWRYSVPGSPRSLLLSNSGHRLIMACGEGSILIYAIDPEMEVLKKYTIADMTQLLLSPLSPEGHFILAVSSRSGLTFLDSRKNISTSEDQNPVTCAALSPDGQYTLLGHATDVSLHRLARPQLRVEFQPVGELQQGRSTRLKIILHNTGERAARNIALQLGEVIGCTEISLPDELHAGKTVASEKQSVTPKASGALPVTSRITYMDDLGVDYAQTDLHIMDVLPGSQ